MSRCALLLAAVLAVACGDDDGPDADAAPLPDATPPDAAGRFELVGESDLGGRGMNSALAVIGDTVYVGSRTDGVRHAAAGVKIVDVSDPSAPALLGELGAPDEGLVGMSSRELRAVPDKHLLVVLNIVCSAQLHDCGRDSSMFPMTGGAAERDNIKLYDVTVPTAPALLGTHTFTSLVALPHEMFLWRDPLAPDRILLYVTTPLGPPELTVLDISDPATPSVLATFDAPFLFDVTNFPRVENLLHSISVSDDGTRAYVAHLGAGMLVLDTSQVAAATPMPVIAQLTPTAARIEYDATGTHSAVKVPGRDVIIMTDEVYEYPYGVGCPWGWMHLADISDPLAPVLLSEFKLPENVAGAGCTATQDPAVPQPNFTAHNPTLTTNLALVTWHAGGLVAVDTTDAAAPVFITSFRPAPRATVATEDPALGDAPVAMWSYPVIQDGLIYVVDVRNGLYILRYTGVHDAEVTAIDFAEGNSNL